MAASAREPGGRWLAPRSICLTSRILTSRSEHASFAKIFESLGGSGVALDYLRQAKVRGFFRGDELLAGYVLNTHAPFRYFAWVPEKARAELHNGGLVEPLSAELTCMWMTKRLRQLERNRVYVQIVVDAFSCGKRLIFAGSRVEGLARIQKACLPRTVYKGPATFDGTCEIYCANRYAMVAHLVTAAIPKYARDLARMIRRAWPRPTTGRRVPITAVHPSSDGAPDFTNPNLVQI